MINAQQFERIQQLVQPIIAISEWLKPKVLTVLTVGILAVSWFVFYVLQFWSWHYVMLIPLFFLALPLIILAIWTFMLMDLADLPEALDSLKEGVTGLKERATSSDSNKTEVQKAAMSLRKSRQLPTLLKELFGLVQGVDAVRTIVTHVIFLANPISWLLFILSCLSVFVYAVVAIVTGLFFVF